MDAALANLHFAIGDGFRVGEGLTGAAGWKRSGMKKMVADL